MGKTLSVANIQTSLTREQKEAVGLLSIGTFLEYFDLMLYVHMAVLLDELFFPKTDPFTSSLLTAFAFCSTYALRPLGALIFGYIGDKIGRKATIIITTFLMSISCTIMAVSPTYAEIGITASIIMILCRMAQGLSSMGEKVGAEIYLTETFKPPLQYFVVSAVPTASTIGTSFALLISTIMTSQGFNWRYAFGIGAVVAVIGFVARATLKESPEFLNARNEYLKNTELDKKPNPKTILALFLIHCAHPVWVYVIYMFAGDFLKKNFGFSAAEVIQRNFYISLVGLFMCIFLTFLSYRVYPLRIMNIVFKINFLGMIIFVFLFYNKNITLGIITAFQFFVAFCAPTSFPGTPIFLKYFPILKRFTVVSLIYAFSRFFMYVITSFGIVILVRYFGNLNGVMIIVVPMLIAYYWSLKYFEKLEKVDLNYHQKI